MSLMKYTLPQLNYSYDALEPYIDKQTMEIHHSKHHQGYVDKLNAVLEKYPELMDQKLEDLITNLATLPMDESDKTALRNNGGGHSNHTLFWKILDPNNQPNQELIKEIEKNFGSVEKWKEEFSNSAASHFGSGWAWLVRDKSGKLLTYSLPNQDSPYLKGHTPLIGLDVWEHAYYLKYQNRRKEYIDNWWKVLKLV